jgi:hypothetical protein
VQSICFRYNYNHSYIFDHPVEAQLWAHYTPSHTYHNCSAPQHSSWLVHPNNAMYSRNALDAVGNTVELGVGCGSSNHDPRVTIRCGSHAPDSTHADFSGSSLPMNVSMRCSGCRTSDASGLRVIALRTAASFSCSWVISSGSGWLLAFTYSRKSCLFCSLARSSSSSLSGGSTNGMADEDRKLLLAHPPPAEPS